MENVHLEDLSEEQKLEQIEQLKIERRQKYKDLREYTLSDKYKKLCEHFNKKGDDLLEVIKTELAKRKVTVAVKSELDQIMSRKEFFEEVNKKVGKTEGELIVKEHFEEQIINAESIIYNKTDELFDVPVFSAIDMIRQKRIDYMTINRRIEQLVESYNDEKHVDVSTAGNPYVKS